MPSSEPIRAADVWLGVKLGCVMAVGAALFYAFLLVCTPRSSWLGEAIAARVCGSTGL